MIGARQPCAAVHAGRTGRRSLTLRSAARAARGSRSKPIKNIVTTVGKGTDHIPQTLPTNGDGTAADDARGGRGAAIRRRCRPNQRARAAAARARGAPRDENDRGGAAAAGGARGGGGDGTARRAARCAAPTAPPPPVALPDAPPAAPPLPPPPPVEAAAPPPSPPPDDDASDACASPPAAHRWRRYYDAETRAHYWYDARTQVVSWSDPERPPRDPAHARRPTAASLARSLPGSPQRLRFHCCAVESADSEPEEEPKPQRRRRPAPGYLKARRTPRRGAYEKGPALNPETVTRCVFTYYGPSSGTSGSRAVLTVSSMRQGFPRAST